MINYYCKKCGYNYYVSELDKNLHLLSDEMRCCTTRPPCKGKLVATGEKDLPHAVRCYSMEALELYKETRGLGTPKERKCGPAMVKKVLNGAKVVGAHVRASNDKDRSVLMSLSLADGREIHLGASPLGAIVYRITEVPRGR